MKNITPETIEIICDVCKKPAERKHEGRLILERSCLDSSGAPVADGTVRRDLCDACLPKIERAVNEETEGIRKRACVVDIVFDGPPSHESGRFIEVEDENGASVHVGAWIDRGDGMWALRLETRKASVAGESHD